MKYGTDVWTAAAVAAIAITATGNAQVFSTGFESGEGYTAGVELANQGQGWETASGAVGGFTVVDNFARTGNQSVRAVHPAPQAGTIHYARRAFSPAPGNDQFHLSAWFYVDSSTPEQGRYFGLQMGTAVGNEGSILVGASLTGNGEIRAATTNLFGAPAVIDSGRRDDFIDRWVQISIDANLASTVDNAVVTFSNLGDSAGPSTVSATFSRDFATFATLSLINSWSVGSTSPGLAYIDDFVATAIPAPGVLAILGIAGLLGCGRRRR